MITSLVFKCPFKSTSVYKQISFANIFCLPLIFSYPHPVLIQQTFKGRPYRAGLRLCCSLIVREGGGFENQNRTQKPCPLNRLINSFEVNCCFCYICCPRGIFRFRKIYIEKKKHKEAQLCVLSMWKTSTVNHSLEWQFI